MKIKVYVDEEQANLGKREKYVFPMCDTSDMREN